MMEDILLKIGAALFMVFFFGFCIFIHELGHFLAARWRGLRVLAFSIGFKKIWAKKIGGVEYRIGCVPFGGYVEIPQIDATGEAKDEEGNILPKAKPLDRMIAVFAGPLFNILFGFALGCVVWFFGIPRDTPVLSEFEVVTIEEKSPEYRAGLRKGDLIYKLNDRSFSLTWNKFVNEILLTIGPVKLDVKHPATGESRTVAYKPEVNPKIRPEEGIAYPFFIPKIPVTVYPRKGGAADRGGMKAGDILLKAGDEEINSYSDLIRALDLSNGKSIPFEVLRGGRKMALAVTPSAEKDEAGRQGRYLIGIQGNPAVRILPGRACAKAGMREGDRIVKLGSAKVSGMEEISKIVDSSGGKALEVEYLRDGNTLRAELVPEFFRYYDLDVRYYSVEHPTPLKQFNDVITMTVRSLRSIGVGIARKLRLSTEYTTIGPQHMSGPLGIGRVLYVSVYRFSFVYGLSFVVLITFSLGLLNLLPIPILDGGHILLALLEVIFRRPVPKKILEPISIVFVVVLVGFMLFVTFFDIKRIAYPYLGFGKSGSGQEKQETILSAPAKTPPASLPEKSASSAGSDRKESGK